MSNSKKWGLSIAAIVVVAGCVLIYRYRRLFLVSDVTTGQSLDYPDLRTHIYSSTINEVADAAEQAINSITRWRLVFHDRDKRILLAEVEGPIGGYLSDVTVTLSPVGEKLVRAVIRSRSSSGRGDLGENARYIRQLQDFMDRSLLS